MRIKYKVERLQGDTWQVIKHCTPTYEDDNDTYARPEWAETAYQGSLSDCEAYIRLEKEGYL